MKKNMPRERSFYFLPLESRFGRVAQKKPYCKIYAHGILHISKDSMVGLNGKSGSLFVHLYCDIEKRAVAFKFEDSYKGVVKRGGGVRFIKLNRTAAGYESYTINVKKFIGDIGGITSSTPRLEFNKYTDELMGELWYITIPKNLNKPKEENNE